MTFPAELGWRAAAAAGPTQVCSSQPPDPPALHIGTIDLSIHLKIKIKVSVFFNLI